MRLHSALAVLLLSFALIGAPFGMGRMMDGQTSHGAMPVMEHIGATEGMDHGSAPVRKSSGPRYMTCSACAAAPVIFAEAVHIAVLADMPNLPDDAGLDGTHFLPPTPPPRA